MLCYRNTANYERQPNHENYPCAASSGDSVSRPPAHSFSPDRGAGTLTGTVTDASGAVVPEARIVAHNEDTGAEREVSTNGAGIYVAAFLQPANWPPNLA